MTAHQFLEGAGILWTLALISVAISMWRGPRPKP